MWVYEGTGVSRWAGVRGTCRSSLLIAFIFSLKQEASSSAARLGKEVQEV